MTRYAHVILVSLLLLAPLEICAQTNDVLSLLSSNEFGKVDEVVGAVQRRFENGELTEYDLRNAFRPFYRADEKSLRNWVANSPRSYSARLALGTLLKRLGGKARGTEYISKTPQKNIDEMERYFQLSESELRTSLELTKMPYLSIFHLLEINGNRADRSASDALLQRANKFLPNNALVRNRYAIYLLPRWGGSYAEVQRFIESSERQGAPRNVIVQLNAIMHNDIGHSLREQGEIVAANEQSELALRLGQTVGENFSVEFLSSSRYDLCRPPNAPPYCQSDSRSNQGLQHFTPGIAPGL